MKKIYLLAISLIALCSLKSKAQDTLIYESFDFQAFYDNMVTGFPPAVSADAAWYNYDGDAHADGSGNSREDAWFAVLPFSDVDTVNSNAAIGSNSWFTAPAAVDNWLISPSITLEAHDTLFWKSAPSQTPRYADGYKVKISTTDNDILSFGTTLYTAAEMTALSSQGEDTVYSNFTFGPSGAFVHGADGTYIDPADLTATHLLHNGRLRPFYVALDAYAGQNVFIAFHHDSYDDNMISIDDFMIRGTNLAAGVKEDKKELGLNVFPNPAVDAAQVNYNLDSETSVIISIYDVTGKLISSLNKGTQAAGRHFSMINTAEMANGFYTVTVQTGATRSTTKLIVK